MTIQAKRARDKMKQAGFQLKDFSVTTEKLWRNPKNEKRFYEFGDAIIRMKCVYADKRIAERFDAILEAGLGITVFKFEDGAEHYRIDTQYSKEGKVDVIECF